MRLADFGHDSFLVRFVFVSAGINFADKQVEIRIGSQGPFRYQFFSARRTFLVTGSQSSYYAIRTEPVKAFLGGHRLFKHVQANRTHEFAVQRPWRDRYFGVICNRFLRSSL